MLVRRGRRDILGGRSAVCVVWFEFFFVGMYLFWFLFFRGAVKIWGMDRWMFDQMTICREEKRRFLYVWRACWMCVG